VGEIRFTLPELIRPASSDTSASYWRHRERIPSALTAVGKTLSAAGEEIVGNFGKDRADAPARSSPTRCSQSLAKTVGDVEVLKSVALQRMAIDYRHKSSTGNRLLIASHVSGDGARPGPWVEGRARPLVGPSQEGQTVPPRA
jgi:hypothetical protein